MKLLCAGAGRPWRPRSPADSLYSGNVQSLTRAPLPPAPRVEGRRRRRAPGNPRPPQRPAFVHLRTPSAFVPVALQPGSHPFWLGAAGLSGRAVASACVANKSPAGSSAQRARGRGRCRGGGGSPGASRGDPPGPLHL